MQQHDILRRFMFDQLGIRGEWVRLTQSFQAAKQHQPGNACMQQQLGEALAAVVLLSATLKFKGSLILQAQGNGDLKTLVAQATHDRSIRGLVKGNTTAVGGTLTQLFGEGVMVLTIKAEAAEPYQGIVPLVGDTIAGVLETYFAQSEQLPTRLWLFADAHQAVGLFLQALPDHAPQQEGWSRLGVLANTVTAAELMTLSCEEMLYRLFHEEVVTLFDPEAVNFACSCTPQKIAQVLYAMGRAELEEILAEQQEISVYCEFCGRHYVFDRVDVERLLLGELDTALDSSARH